MANNYWIEKLSQVIGGTILNVVKDKSRDDEHASTDEPFLGLEILMPNGKIKLLWFLSDEKGNAPGRFDIMNDN